MSTVADENIGFIDCWNTILVPKWNRFRHLLSGNGEIHSSIAYKYFEIKKGDKVVDVGCGYGETCLEIGQIVGPEGEVLGLDCTQSFLDAAIRERDEAGLAQVHFELGDAQVHPVQEGYFDVGFSRFGVMFFENPVIALKNVFRALKPQGKVCLIVWRRIEDNPCWGIAKEIALKHLPPPGDQAKTCGPGPFSWAGEDTDRAMLKAAGFPEVELFKRIDADVCMGTDLEEAVDFQILVGPSGEIIREAGEEGEQKLPEVRQEMKDHLSQHLRKGGVYLPSSTWAIMARKPAS
ncbi:MAG: class I SAM-dependent methyltransferase [Acidiferrobacterales bacterium]